MAWAFTIATRKHDCPFCGIPKGFYCSTLEGKQLKRPHASRIALLTKEEWNSCTHNQALAKRVQAGNSLCGIWKDLPKKVKKELMED